MVLQEQLPGEKQLFKTCFRGVVGKLLMHFIITFAENKADLNNNSFNNCWKAFKGGCKAEPYTNFS